MAVDREVVKVLSKFESIRQNFNNVLQKLIDNFELINSNLQTNTDGKMLIILYVLITIIHSLTFLLNSIL